MPHVTITIEYKDKDLQPRFQLDMPAMGGRIVDAMLGDGISQLEDMEKKLERVEAELEELDIATLA